MNKNKLAKLKKKLESLRNRKGNFNEKELVSFANDCGRKLKTGGMGKHPAYINVNLPNKRPLSIPSHPGNMPAGTAGNILDILESDLFELEEILDK
jgi:hypothetical protein